MNPYEEHGYADRAAYLKALAEQAGPDGHLVYLAADLLGEEEDFDLLISTLNDQGVEIYID